MPHHPPKNTTHFWRPELATGLSLMTADLTTQAFPPHVHDALVIAITEAGGAVARSRGEAYLAEPELMLVFNPAEPHSGDMGSSSHWLYRSLYFETSALQTLKETLQATDHLYFTHNGIRDSELCAAFRDLHAALEEGDDHFAIDEKLTQTMGLLYTRHGEAQPAPPPDSRNRMIVDKVVRIFKDGFAEPLQLPEVADAVGLTQFQLIGLFKRSLGLTPYALLTQIRLNVACSMLRDGMAISEVAVATGFYDQSALTKHFRSRFAITPAQFAQCASA